MGKSSSLLLGGVIVGISGYALWQRLGPSRVLRVAKTSQYQGQIVTDIKRDPNDSRFLIGTAKDGTQLRGIALKKGDGSEVVEWSPLP